MVETTKLFFFSASVLVDCRANNKIDGLLIFGTAGQACSDGQVDLNTSTETSTSEDNSLGKGFSEKIQSLLEEPFIEFKL